MNTVFFVLRLCQDDVPLVRLLDRRTCRCVLRVPLLQVFKVLEGKEVDEHGVGLALERREEH